MKCPKCRRYVEDGSESHSVCGWNVHQEAAPQPSAGYRPCEWTSDGRKCCYPASISTNTHQGGPWYCYLHFDCDSAGYGAQVVEASLSYRHPAPGELDAENMDGVRARLKALGLERNPGESVKAWMKRTSEWMRNKNRVKRFEDAA